jgi:hypothetical protein
MAMSQQPQMSGQITSTPESDAAEFVAGFQRVEAEIRAVSERELVPVNVDVPSAVATVLGALPEIRALRGTFAQLMGFDIARFDKLRDYTLALGHTHAIYRGATGPSDGLSALVESVTALRDMLEADALALAKRKILDEAQVTKLRGGSGYKNIAFEVAGFVGLFREHWDSIKGRSALQQDELEHAGELAQQLVTAIGMKEQGPVVVNAASALRQRAFTLFTNAYDDVRRAVSYLHWSDGGADDIAPSLYAGRGGRGTPDQPPAPAPAPPAPPTPPAAGTPPVSQFAATATPVIGTHVGLPDSPPFGRS